MSVGVIFWGDDVTVPTPLVDRSETDGKEHAKVSGAGREGTQAVLGNGRKGSRVRVCAKELM